MQNKGTDQLCGNCAADQRLCFHYIDCTILLLHESQISSLKLSSVVVQPGWCRAWSETQTTGFLTMRLILYLEASGLFLGESILQYKYNPQFEAAQTTTEQLELVFQVDRGATNNMILVFIVSERLVIISSYQLIKGRNQTLQMSLVLRKPDFRVSDQVPHKSGCTATEDG